MDGNLVNNQIVLMRKNIRIVKRFVYQKLLKQIKRLEVRNTKKQNENLCKKFENKIQNKRKELVSMKGLNVDEVSKQALVSNREHFEGVLKSSQTSVESKVLARICLTESIQKAVNKFKDENPNCEEWLPSQIELWQQKKLIKRNRILQKKGLTSEESNETTGQSIGSELSENESKPNESDLDSESNETDLKTSKASEVKPKKKPKVKAIETKKNRKSDSQTKDENKTNEGVVEKEEIKTKPKSDPFFLSNDPNDEQSDDSEDRNEKQMKPKNNFTKREFKSNFERKPKFSERIAKRDSFPTNNKSFNKRNSKKFANNDMKQQNKGPSVAEESLHPSWAAKRSVKDKFKIDLNRKPMAKKIRFDDN